MKHRKVLTINQGKTLYIYSSIFLNIDISVFEILLLVSEGKTFKEAFEGIIPERIQRVSKAKSIEELDSDTRTSNDNNDES